MLSTPSVHRREPVAIENELALKEVKIIQGMAVAILTFLHPWDERALRGRLALAFGCLFHGVNLHFEFSRRRTWTLLTQVLQCITQRRAGDFDEAVQGLVQFENQEDGRGDRARAHGEDHECADIPRGEDAETEE